MAAENALMRPLGPDSLKARPSTQAVWEPDRPDVKNIPQPVSEQEPVPEPAAEEIPAVQEAPAVQEPVPEPVFTFAPACGAQPESRPETFQQEVMEEEDEAPFDLDAVIAAILAEDDEDEEDEEHSASQDAMPTEEMPEPATVPLYDAPAARRRGREWILLIVFALIMAAAGYAAMRLGWLG